MRTKYSKELIQGLVNKFDSYAKICRALGLGYNGGNFNHMKRIVQFYNIDTHHFKGKAWNKGRKILNRRKAPSEYLKIYENSTPQSYKMKVKILRDGVKEHRCDKCGNTMWMEKNTTRITS